MSSSSEKKSFRTLIAPSILSANFAELATEIKTVTDAGADWLHVDVMDGNFVPNLTIGMPVVKAIKPYAKIPLDVHLMIDQPERYVDGFLDAGSDYLTLHVESTTEEKLRESFKKIKARGCKAGITLRPRTNLQTIEKFLPEIDLVLVMTVEPGFGGQSFMQEQVSKIQQLAAWKKQGRGNYLIEVDGGIVAETGRICREAGADVFVAGSAVFKGDKTVANYQKNIDLLRG